MTESENTSEVIDNTMAERRLHAAWVALQDAERVEMTAREEAERKRLAVAKLLVAERKRFPKSGPAAAGWGELIARVGIAQQRAWELMRLVEISPPGGETLPSLRDAGIKPRERGTSRQRPRTQQLDSDDAEQSELDGEGSGALAPRTDSTSRVAAGIDRRPVRELIPSRAAPRRGDPTGESGLLVSLKRDIASEIAGIENLPDLSRTLRDIADRIDCMADESDMES